MADVIDGSDVLAGWLSAVVIVTIGIMLIGLVVAGSHLFRREAWQNKGNADFNAISEVRRVVSTALGFVVALSLNAAVQKTVEFTRNGCKAPAPVAAA